MMKIPFSDKASSSALNNTYIAIFYMKVLCLPDVQYKEVLRVSNAGAGVVP